MQEMWVWSLIWEDFTFFWATKPMSQFLSLCYRAQELQLLSPRGATPKACVHQSRCSTTRETTTVRSPRTSTRESSGTAMKCQTVHCNKDPAQTKMQWKILKKSVLSCLENPMDNGAWWAMVCSVKKSGTWLKWLSMQLFLFYQP